jgi:hypothetical protein
MSPSLAPLLDSLAARVYNSVHTIHRINIRLPSMAATTAAKQEQKNGQLINPFYSPSFIDDGDEQYKYAQFKVRAMPGPRNSLYLLTPHSAFLSGRFLGPAKRGQSNRCGPAGKFREETTLIGGI